MISYVVGDLFESPAQTLVNTVNTVGVMGKGIALEFKRIYPEMFEDYQRICEAGELRIGTLHLHRTENKWVLNFPTKTSWRKPSQLEYIRAGLQTFRDIYRKAGIYSVAFPPLGCGNGELNYDDVRPVMEEFLHDLPIDVFMYTPLVRSEPPEHRDPEQIKQWLRSTPQYLSFEEVWIDLQELIAMQPVFSTFTGSGEFTASIIDAGLETEGIRVVTPSNRARFSREELCERWAELRQHKILTSKDLPAERARLASYLFPILAELPYVRRILLADSYTGLEMSPPSGIQLLPVSGHQSTRQRELAIA